MFKLANNFVTLIIFTTFLNKLLLPDIAGFFSREDGVDSFSLQKEFSHLIFVGES